jgi:hypothetical protein
METLPIGDAALYGSDLAGAEFRALSSVHHESDSGQNMPWKTPPTWHNAVDIVAAVVNVTEQILIECIEPAVLCSVQTPFLAQQSTQQPCHWGPAEKGYAVQQQPWLPGVLAMA